MHLMVRAIPRSIAGALLRPEPESVHALIEPSALRAAKPKSFESTRWQRLYRDLFKSICLCCS
jgi:hypothetical protein